MSTEVQTPVLPTAGLHKMTPSLALKMHRPESGGCLSLAQLKEMYSDQPAKASPGKGRVILCRRPTPASSPVTSRSASPEPRCSPRGLATIARSASTSSSHVSPPGTDVSAQMSSLSKSRLGKGGSKSAASRLMTEALEQAFDPQGLDPGLRHKDEGNAQGEEKTRASRDVRRRSCEERPRAGFYKSQSLRVGGLAAKSCLKVTQCQERELRQARSLGRRVCFKNQVEVVVYP